MKKQNKKKKKGYRKTLHIMNSTVISSNSGRFFCPYSTFLCFSARGGTVLGLVLKGKRLIKKRSTLNPL